MAAKKPSYPHNPLSEALRVAKEEDLQLDVNQLVELSGVLVLDKIASAIQSLADSVKGLQ